MNTNTIYLVRHAVSRGHDQNVIDSVDPRFDGLSEEGKRDAQKLIDALAQNQYDIIYSSPLLRCKETLAPYLEKYPHDVQYDDRLKERNAGIFIGEQRGALKKYCEKNGIADQARFRPEGGESLEDVLTRARGFFKDKVEPLKGKKILICGHRMGLLCLDLALHHYGLEDLEKVTPLIEGEVRRVEISNEDHKQELKLRK